MMTPLEEAVTQVAKEMHDINFTYEELLSKCYHLHHVFAGGVPLISMVALKVWRRKEIKKATSTKDLQDVLLSMI